MICLEETEKKNTEFKLTALDSANNVVEIVVYECLTCGELVPKVGNCPQCGTAYDHLRTIENFRTGFFNWSEPHFVYNQLRNFPT